MTPIDSISARLGLVLTLVMGVATTACGGAAELAAGADESGGPGSGVGQIGTQDFGLFRSILERGEIPGPSTLDSIGFFAEHKLDYPAPNCGEDLCMHGLLGVQGNMITGNECTLIQLGLNSPIDVDELDRPPLDLMVTVDTSGSMSGAPIEFVRSGLLSMLNELDPEDRLTLIAYSNEADVRILRAHPYVDREAIESAIASLQASGATNIYDGLFTAYELLEQELSNDRQARVLLLSDGVATEGIDDPSRFSSLAAGYAKLGVGTTTIGVGAEFDVELMRAVAEVGAGNFYFLEDPTAVEEVFTEEVRTFLVPLAVDVKIDIVVNGDFTLRQAYGTNGFTGSLGEGQIAIPALFLAGRVSADEPIDEGRRGGGGAILLELLSEAAPQTPDHVANLLISWTDPASQERFEQAVNVVNPRAEGTVPEAGFFTDSTVEKGFVMLNIFAGFELATELAADGDPGTARGTLEALRPEVATWVADSPDADIEDDLYYIDLFIQNLAAAEVQTPVRTPAEPWPAD